MKNVLIFILLAVIIVLGYLQFKTKKTDVAVDTQIPTGQTQTTYNANGNDYQLTPSNNADTNTVQENWGSFTKGSDWAVINESTNKTTLKQGGQDGDVITIEYIKANSITDTDAKFGNITFYFDANLQSWMVESPNEQYGGTYPAVKATATMTSNSGLPIFRGTGRWATYIVPLSHSTFLKLNIGGSGASQPLTDLVKTVKVK